LGDGARVADGELRSDDAAVLAEHLSNCLHCSTEYETTLAPVATLRFQLERFGAPDLLRPRIRASSLASLAVTETVLTARDSAGEST
jgi:anti-sigma factor RsiW